MKVTDAGRCWEYGFMLFVCLQDYVWTYTHNSLEMESSLKLFFRLERVMRSEFISAQLAWVEAGK